MERKRRDRTARGGHKNEISHLHFLEFFTASHPGFLQIRTKCFKGFPGKKNRACVCIYIHTNT